MIAKITPKKCVLAALALAAIGTAAAQPVPGVPGYPAGKECAQEAIPTSRVAAQVAGRWTVTFANGVVETCEIGQNGVVTVDEPQRSSSGKARIREGDLMLQFEDDRIERWTRVGSLMVVEHWFPTAAFASQRPVLGIAERSGE